MPTRKNNDTFLDKFLGVFGIRRPKKHKKVVSKRREERPRNDVEINHGFEIPLNDNYQIMSDTNSPAQHRARDIRSQSEEISSNRKKAVKNTNRQPKKPKKEKKRHPVLHALLSIFLVIVITCCIVISAALIYVFVFIDDTVDADLYNLKLEYTSILYAKDSKGKDVELKRLHGEQNRLWVDNDDIPDNVRNAFISCEDKRFREHSGTDWKRTITAAANEVLHFHSKEGGSTITQQLVKNITGDNQQDYARKIREIMRARYLEQHYDKDTILDCYLNTIHLGNGVDGVEVASNYYFDKHVSDITLTQAACLAAITNNPSQNEPYKYPETNKTRRNWVLNEMYKNGYISKDECEKAKKADLGLRKNPSTVLSTTKTVKGEEYNSYFVDAVIDDVIDGLVAEKGYTKEYAASQLYKGGYKIYTTVDLDMQDKLEEVYENDDNFMKVYTKSGKKPQSAMTIMDYKGNVKAIVGGRGKKNGNRVLNRATQSARPTGSSIKPISVYAPAIEYNTITWGSSIEDKPIEIVEDGQTIKWPKNYDNTYSGGKTSVLRALQKSLNTVPVRILQDLTIDTSYKFVTEKLGLKHFVSESKDGNTDKNMSSLALGGSVHGATTLEMAAAFSTFGNGGIYYTPRTYTKVLDQNNEVVIDNTNNQQRAMSEGTANIMCKMLQTVATSGTGTAAQFGDWQIMCKTGTTSNYKDRWFVGGTPYYMAACWFGLDDPEEMKGMYMNPAIILWKAAMSSIHKDLDEKEFETSDKVEYRRYCTTSGLCARTGCPSTAYGYFKSSYTPFCNYHGGAETGVSEEKDYHDYYNSDSNNSSKTTTKTKKTESTSAAQSSTQATDSSQQSTQADQTNDGEEHKTEAPESTTAKPTKKTKVVTTKKQIASTKKPKATKKAG